MLYSIFIVSRNKGKFKKEFSKMIKMPMFLIFVVLMLAIISFIILISGIWAGIILILFPFVFVYVKSLEKCMIKKVGYGDLTEGDWLEEDIRIGKKIIRKSVHGLTLNEIEMLQKAKKSVLVREGIPFAVVFLIALVMVLAFVALKLEIFEIFSLF